ncbi:MAG: YkgJ family cysteine cluster protein [Nitrospirota bacterium]
MRARAASLGALPCGRGCSQCCIGPFAITLVDAAELQRGLASLAESVRRGIRAQASRQVSTIEAEFPRLRESPFLDEWSEADLDVLVERFAHLPCPALAPDGSCRIYAFRPVTCRMMGIPVEADGLVEGACSVQTAVPVVRLPSRLRREEQGLAEREAAALVLLHRATGAAGDEVLLPYGFLSERLPAN